jgi:hypothetical protein
MESHRGMGDCGGGHAPVNPNEIWDRGEIRHHQHGDHSIDLDGTVYGSSIFAAWGCSPNMGAGGVNRKDVGDRVNRDHGNHGAWHRIIDHFQGLARCK